MNKTITSIIALLLGSAASHAVVTVTADGVNVADGSTITIDKNDFELKMGAPLFRWEGGTEITVEGQFPITVNLISDGTDIQFCPLGQQCYVLRESGDIFTGSGSITEQSNVVPVHVSFMGKEELPVFHQYLDIEMLDKGFNSFKVRIQFDTEHAGVENVTPDNYSISFSDNTLHFSVGTVSELNVWTVTGNRVINAMVDAVGSYDLAALPKGIYVYRLAGHTGKILVK